MPTQGSPQIFSSGNFPNQNNCSQWHKIQYIACEWKLSPKKLGPPPSLDPSNSSSTELGPEIKEIQMKISEKHTWGKWEIQYRIDFCQSSKVEILSNFSLTH